VRYFRATPKRAIGFPAASPVAQRQAPRSVFSNRIALPRLSTGPKTEVGRARIGRDVGRHGIVRAYRDNPVWPPWSRSYSPGIWADPRGAGRLAARVDERVARHVAELLTSQNPRDLIRGVQIVANRPLARGLPPGFTRAGAEQAARATSILPSGLR
jgi:hypothetical protein